MTSSMHAIGASFAPPSIVAGRALPAPVVVIPPPTAPRPAWGLPLVSTRVELPAPPLWAAPDPELLMTLSMAPLRLAPVSWNPPTIVRSPWAPPVPRLDSYGASAVPASPVATIGPAPVARPSRTRSLAYAAAAVAAIGAGFVAIIVSR